MSDASLEQRVQWLEDHQAICALKSRYFACCDAKDPQGMRACFADGAVNIDYGVVGKFDRADALVEVFTNVACHPHMVEMHHGVNPQIARIDANRASGHWGLHYQLINTKELSLTQLGAYYEDEYLRTAQGWRMSATRCVVTSTLVLQLGEEGVRKMFAGNAPPA